MIKFGQKIYVQRNGEWELAVCLRHEGETVFAGLSDGTVEQIAQERVRTKNQQWRATHRERLRQLQRQWSVRKAAEKAGMTLQEYVYALEAKKAKKLAERDPKEKRREYWRKAQQAHRAKKKAEADEK